MNVYSKLQTVRCELQKTKLKKSGENTYSGYDYFELADFLPTINELMLNHRLTSHISFTSDQATLRIVNIDKPDDVVEFTSPMSSASLKGCHEVQNLGAVQTYLRRYLYLNAFEISESEVLDKLHDKKQEVAKTIAKAEQAFEAKRVPYYPPVMPRDNRNGL